MVTNRNKFKSGEPDGATAIAHEFDTTESLTTAGAKLFKISNAAVEKFSIDADGKITSSSLPMIIVKPSEGSAGIQSAINSLPLTGGVVQLLAGTYDFTGTITIASTRSNTVIQGVGPSSILQFNSDLSTWGILISPSTAGMYNINNTTEDDTSIFTTTAADAGNILAGDKVFLQNGADSGATTEKEYHIASADGIPGTGEIPLVEPVKRTMTSVTMRRVRGGDGHTFKDFTIRAANTAYTTPIAMRLDYSSNLLIDNVEIENIDGGASYHAMSIQGAGFKNTIQNCTFKNTNRAAIIMSHNINSKIINCKTTNTVKGAFAVSTIQLAYCRECLIDSNMIEISGGGGIQLHYGLRNIVSNNHINKVDRYGIDILTAESIVSNNICENVSITGINVYANMFDMVINSNVVKNCAYGIALGLGASDCTISNNIVDTITTGDGIYAPGSDHVISGNVLKNITGDGIQVDADNCIVSGNHVEDEDIVINGTGVTSGLNNDGGHFLKRIAVTDNYTTDGESLIAVTDTTYPRTITISSEDIAKGRPDEAYQIIVKDESGGAGANNITIDTEGSEKINGLDDVDITENYGSAVLYSNGTNLFTY